MWRFVVCLLTLLTGAARADVLPPDVAALRAKMESADAKLASVKAMVEAAQRHSRSADANLRALVDMELRARGYPPGFWLARSVATNTPASSGMVARVVAMQSRELVRSQQRAGELAALYGNLNRELDKVRNVQNAYDDARGRLHAAERDVLRRAGIEADRLSDAMDALQQGEEVVVPVSEVVPVAPVPVAPVIAVAAPVAAPEVVPVAPSIAPGWPVAGRLVRAFGSGEGAMRGGVVLKAAAGADVRAPVAGTVLYAGPFRQFGGLVILKAASGEDMVLGGLETLGVNADTTVQAGQRLGSLGDEGRLYWEVRRRGRGVDPMRNLAGR